MTGASLIYEFAHAYASVPIAVPAEALVILEAPPAILKTCLQQVVFVDASDLSPFAVEIRPARVHVFHRLVSD